MPQIDWTGYDEVAKEFLNAQKSGTRHTYKSVFKLILTYPNWEDKRLGQTLTTKEILESKRADKEFLWERKVITFRTWIKEQNTKNGDFYSDSHADAGVCALRSFFDYYRTPFVFNQGETRKLCTKSQRKHKDYMLVNEDIPKLVLVADLREKYIVLVGKSFGLRISDFNAFTFGTFRSLNLDQETPVFIGEIVTGKEGAPAFPFIDADALPIIKAVLDANRNKADDARVVTVKNEEVTTILQTLAAKANLQLGGKHLRFHCFRKYLIDRLSACMSESKWKQIVGKAISEDAYVSSFELRECYVKAMKLTTVGVNGNGKVSRLAEEVEGLSKKVSEKEKVIELLLQYKETKDKEVAEVRTEIMELKKNMLTAEEKAWVKLMGEASQKDKLRFTK